MSGVDPIIIPLAVVFVLGMYVTKTGIGQTKQRLKYTFPEVEQIELGIVDPYKVVSGVLFSIFSLLGAVYNIIF